jgi:hypothetical protein
MAATPYPDIPGEAFAKRLANLLVATRVRDGVSVGSMARRSHGAYTKNQLRAYETGTYLFPDGAPEQLSLLYGCDLAAILPERTPIEVTDGILSVGGVSIDFVAGDDRSLLHQYLVLVRSLRRQETAAEVALRRDDVATLATHTGRSHDDVLAVLLSLMSATRSKRAAMVGLLATSVAVLGLVGTAAAVGTSSDTPATTTVVVTTVVEATSTTGVAPSISSSSVPPASTTSTVVVTSAPATPVPTVTQPAIVGTDVRLPTTTSAVVDGGPPPIP